jgi:transcriptional regulator with XRE-family HTH domain
MRALGTSKRSQFAQALVGLLDDVGFYTREEWAEFLRISPSAISQWVNDKTLPRADLLAMVLDLLRLRGGETAKEALKYFDHVAALPVAEVSPLGARMAPNVASYMEANSFATLGSQLRGLSREQQHAALREGSWNSSVAEVNADDDTMKSEATAEFDAATHLRHVHVLPDVQRIEGGRKGARAHWASLAKEHCTVLTAGAGTGKSSVLAALVERYRAQSHGRAFFLNAVDYESKSMKPFVDVFDQIEPALIVIDGFDEVRAELRGDLARLVRDGLRRASSAKCIVGSRPTPELKLLNTFAFYSLAPLTDVQTVAALSAATDRGANTHELSRFLFHMTEKPALQSILSVPLFLSVAWKLFELSAVTPFFETQVLSECVRGILDHDVRKNVVRVREPWASTQCLSSLLGAISLHSINQGKASFRSEEVLDWIDPEYSHVPVQDLMSLLEVHGFVSRDDVEHFSLKNETFREYFAASYIVESARNAGDYLKHWDKNPQLREVLRLACGLSSDATSLLQGVLENKRVAPAKRGAVLADMLAQPIRASQQAVKASANAIVGWLDHELDDWSVEATSFAPDNAGQISWAMAAKGKPIGASRDEVGSTLSAIHRARSGNAHESLRERMKGAASPVLAEFADCLEVEGKLELTLGGGKSADKLRAEVGELQLH